MKLEEIALHASYELNYLELEHCCLIKSSCTTLQKILVYGVRITGSGTYDHRQQNMIYLYTPLSVV